MDLYELDELNQQPHKYISLHSNNKLIMALWTLCPVSHQQHQ